MYISTSFSCAASLCILTSLWLAYYTLLYHDNTFPFQYSLVLAISFAIAIKKSKVCKQGDKNSSSYRKWMKIGKITLCHAYRLSPSNQKKTFTFFLFLDVCQWFSATSSLFGEKNQIFKSKIKKLFFDVQKCLKFQKSIMVVLKLWSWLEMW